MPDFRIVAGKPAQGDRPESYSLVEALVRSADEVAARYTQMGLNLPYRHFTDQLLEEDIAQLTRDLAAATWKRISEEVPSYAFAEKVGQRYRDAGLSVGALLLHWQLLRRAVHLCLATRHYRTGQGSEEMLRESSLMNYTFDWSVEASLVGFVISTRGEAAEPTQ